MLLDNFEHVSRPADQVADLVSTSPGLKVLVTSREHLRIPPLRVPEAGEGVALSDLGVVGRWLGNRSIGDRYCEQAVAYTLADSDG